eukprot:3925192-Pyramimonas_sp.AAC.1
MDKLVAHLSQRLGEVEDTTAIQRWCPCLGPAMPAWASGAEAEAAAAGDKSHSVPKQPAARRGHSARPAAPSPDGLRTHRVAHSRPLHRPRAPSLERNRPRPPWCWAAGRRCRTAGPGRPGSRG